MIIRTIKNSQFLVLLFCFFLTPSCIRAAQPSRSPVGSTTSNVSSNVSGKVSTWMNTLNPALSSLPTADQQSLLKEAVKLAYSVVSHPDQLTELRGYLNTANLATAAKPQSSSPGVKSGAIMHKSAQEKLFDQRVLVLAGQLVDKHQAGQLNVNNVQKDLGVTLRILPFVAPVKK